MDSTLTVLHLQNSSRYAVEDVQILIYKSDGTRELEQLLRLDEFSETVEVVTTEGEKLVAAVANCGKALSPVALGRYDSLSEFGYDFSDENCETPVMSGECRTRGNMGEISLAPLLCEVVIESVANCLDENYELVENPRVRLTGISGYAGVMQDSDFFPTEIQDRGEWTDLPYDIGMLTQNPGTTLYCYPNETPESSLGSSRTVLGIRMRDIRQSLQFRDSAATFRQRRKTARRTRSLQPGGLSEPHLRRKAYGTGCPTDGMKA